jgi:DNA repair exonuclease SbcCD ATPase subunit
MDNDFELMTEFRQLQRKYEREMALFDDDRKQIRVRNRAITDRERQINKRRLALQQFDDDLENEDPDSFKSEFELKREITELTNKLRMVQSRLKRESAQRSQGGADSSGQRYYIARLENQRDELKSRKMRAEDRITGFRSILTQPVPDIRLEEFDVNEIEADADMCWKKFEVMPELAIDQLMEEERDIEALEATVRERKTELSVWRSRLPRKPVRRQVRRHWYPKTKAPPDLPNRTPEQREPDKIEEFTNEIAKVYEERQDVLRETEALTTVLESKNLEKRKHREAEYELKIKRYQRVKAKLREREQTEFEISELQAQVGLECERLAELQAERKQMAELAINNRRNQRLSHRQAENHRDVEKLERRFAEINQRQEQIEARRIECSRAKAASAAQKKEYHALQQRVADLERSMNDVGRQHDALFRQSQLISTELEADRIEAFSHENVDPNDWDLLFAES